MGKNFDHNGKAEELEVSGPGDSVRPDISGTDYARIAEEIISLGRMTVASSFKIGAMLNAAKKAKGRFPHGTFVEWVTKDCRLEMRTAQKHMRVDKVLREKSELVAHLQPATLYALTAKSAFDRVGSGLIARIEKGEALDDNAIKDALKKACDEARNAKQPQEGSQETSAENEAQPIGGEDAANEAVRMLDNYIPLDVRPRLRRLAAVAGHRFVEQFVSLCAGNPPAQEEGRDAAIQID